MSPFWCSYWQQIVFKTRCFQIHAFSLAFSKKSVFTVEQCERKAKTDKFCYQNLGPRSFLRVPHVQRDLPWLPHSIEKISFSRESGSQARRGPMQNDSCGGARYQYDFGENTLRKRDWITYWSNLGLFTKKPRGHMTWWARGHFAVSSRIISFELDFGQICLQTDTSVFHMFCRSITHVDCCYQSFNHLLYPLNFIC